MVHAPSWHARKGSRSSVVSRRQSLIERYARPDSRASEPILFEEDEDAGELSRDDTLRVLRPTSSLSHTAPLSPSPPSPIHAIATPRPTLLFALASDNVDEVKRVLDSGEVGPNDDVGPQSALAFTLTARQLKHRQEMVKLLLAHGADPVAAKQTIIPSRPTSAGSGEASSEPLPDPLEELDHATKYYIKRAEAPQTRRASALIHRSFFRPLARVRYDLIGQDRALEQLFRVLSMPTMAPVIVLLCGPSGHGKSLLARKFGSLLEVPTHTVNMTTLRDTHDIWRSYSMSPYEAPSTCTLADFLIANEGRRCVVVLDEIEKSPDEKALSSLLMPWELGRCSFEAGHRHVDVSQVIWLGTSNIGHDLVFEHQEKRQDPEAPMSREDYVDLMGLLRPCVSQRLGASLLSRVTTVLPFIPFTTEEKMAIAAEALHSLTSEETELPPATIDMIVRNSLSAYIPAEGARSLYRAVSNLLLDTI
ncbi:P-loop containing nucleoside triphosphate hydrolase protein [Rhodofomes roseus]|uniref:P-loop containing nucleoside triphosphate hydrolase protein n=1 Tax=Rhodofomes roseus TaxID=34475 RepID=A0ABQ8K6N0_9APHY|nr:P-loop containing nucleoside triphosphate hydrolase protein [Rhodofomes roseus]KAH9832896.1 P-loop containing nucleoside triphosphate hydrolase protein [Rhodofomes roseus]